MAPSGMSSGKSFMTSANPEAAFTTRSPFAWWGAGLGSTLPSGPLGRWTLPYSQLTDTQRNVLEAFFEQQLGRYLPFIFLDPMGNLVQSSELFTASSWSLLSATAAAPGATDPYGGSLASVLTGTASNSIIETSVLPAGFAPSGFVLCGSVWAKSASGQSLMIGFVDSGFTVLASKTWTLPAGQWTRISCPVTLSTTSAISMIIGGLATWGSGVAITLFGAQCVPMPGPGGYVNSPAGYGYHPKCRFDMDALEIQHVGPNANRCTVTIQEIF